MAKPKIEKLATGKFLELVKEGKWEYTRRVNASGVVAVVAVTDNDELILTEQFRPAVRMKVIDLPAGLAGDIIGQETEAFQIAAERELLEETGFASNDMTHIFTGPSSPGMVSEMLNVFLTTDVVRKNSGGGDDSEEIKVHLVPLSKIRKWLERKATTKTCIDLKVFTALGILQLYRE